MNEIKLNSREISILEQTKDFEQFGFNGEISKEEIKLLGTQKRMQLKEVLKTNTALSSLINEINSTPEDAPAAPIASPVIPMEDGESTTPETQLPTAKPAEVKKQISGREMSALENSSRGEGFTDLYVIFRGLELGFIPELHKQKFWNLDGKMLAIKDNLVLNKLEYIGSGGPITNGSMTKLSAFNRWLNDINKGLMLDDIHFQKAQAKELLNGINKKAITADFTNINARIRNLDALENAFKAGNTAEILRLKDEFLTLSTKSFDQMAKVHHITLTTTVTQKELDKILEDIRKNESKASKEKVNTDKRVSGKKSIDKLGKDSLSLRSGDHIKVEGTTHAGDMLDFEIKSVKTVGGEKIYTIDYQEFRGGRTHGPRTVAHEIKILPTGEIVNAADSSLLYKGKGFELAGTKKLAIIAKEKELLVKKHNKLAEIKAELAKPHPNMTIVDRLKGEYKTLNSGAEKLGTKAEKSLIKAERKEYHTIKKEILETEKRIEALQNEAKTKLADLDKRVKANPAEAAAAQSEAKVTIKKINDEIITLNDKTRGNIVKLDADEILKLSKESKITKKLIEWNGTADKIAGHKYSKIVMGVAVFTLAFSAKDGVAKMYKEGISKEGLKDIADIGIGFIPVVGGAYDLYIAWDGKDLNNRELSKKERWVRTGFGVVGLIPGGGFLLKGGAKVIKGANGVRLIKSGDALLEGAKLAGKVGTYGYLGCTLAPTVFELGKAGYHTLASGGPKKLVEKIPGADKLPAIN